MATYKEALETYKLATESTQKDIDQLASMGITDSRVNNLRSQLATQRSGVNYANLINAYTAENPNADFSPEMLGYAQLAGDKNLAGLTNVKGVPTQKSAIAQEATNKAGVVAGILKPVQIGTGTGYVPTGSAAEKLQQGLTSGAVSPTNPMQQFQAGMQGNNVNASGIVPSAPDINAKYQQGFTQTQASGLPVSINDGDNRNVVTNALPPTPTTNPVLDNLFAEDKNFANFSKQIQDFLSPQNQQTTLRQEYESLTKAKGIESMNTELMNMKNVIEGTEDDIRTEITKAGGFGTESQVMALTNARNKTLIKNYNNLLQTKQQAEQYVSTLMGLEQADRQAASDKLDKQLNLTFQLADYQQKMQTNAQNVLNNIVNQVGYTGLAQMTQGNPYYTSLVENTLGLGVGGLNQLATYKKPLTAEEELELEYKKGQITAQESALKTDVLQRSKLQAETEKTKAETAAGKPGGISATTQAIINNPSLFDDLTPTEKGKVVTQLQANSYDTSNLGVKGLSDTAIKEIAQTQKALSDLGDLRAIISGNEDKIGPITGLARFNPYSEARKIQADVDRVRQTVGKALEGGVLRKEDEEKYKKILATLADTPSTAIYKIDALISTITRDIENYKSLQQSAGRSLNVSASLQKTGATKVEDLRTKYNY